MSLNSGHETSFSHLSVYSMMSIKDVCDKKMSSLSSNFRRLSAVWEVLRLVKICSCLLIHEWKKTFSAPTFIFKHEG